LFNYWFQRDRVDGYLHYSILSLFTNSCCIQTRLVLEFSNFLSLQTLEKEKNCETQKVEVKEKRVYELEKWVPLNFLDKIA